MRTYLSLPFKVDSLPQTGTAGVVGMPVGRLVTITNGCGNTLGDSSVQRCT